MSSNSRISDENGSFKKPGTPSENRINTFDFDIKEQKELFEDDAYSSCLFKSVSNSDITKFIGESIANLDNDGIDMGDFRNDSLRDSKQNNHVSSTHSADLSYESKIASVNRTAKNLQKNIFDPISASMKNILNRSLSSASFKNIIENKTSYISNSQQIKRQIHSRKQSDTSLISLTADNSANEIMRKIIQEMPYTFMKFKSLRQKQVLLDVAVSTFHSTCIITVVLYLKETLKNDLFIKLIRSYPDAFNEYVYFLKSLNRLHILKMESDNGIDLDLFIVKYIRICKLKYNDQTLTKLNNLLLVSKKFKNLSIYSEIIEKHISLLRCQFAICETEKLKSSESNQGGDSVVSSFTSVLGESSMVTCSYLVRQHFTKVNTFPESLKKEFQLNDKQFEWLILTSLTATESWDNLKDYFNQKNILSIKKYRSFLGFDVICRYLHSQHAPITLLSFMLGNISETDLRLELAEKMGFHKIVIDILISRKERERLIKYVPKIPPEDIVNHSLVASAIQDQSIRWK